MTSASTRWTAIGAAALILMAAGLLLHFRRDQRLGPPGLKFCDIRLTNELGELVTTNSIYLPERLLDYTSDLLAVQRVELNWLPPDTSYGRRIYTAGRDGYQVQVNAVLMGADRTSIHKPEYCLPAQGFQIARRTPMVVHIGGARPFDLPVMRIDAVREIRKPNAAPVRQSAIYVYWFVSGDRLSNSHSERMWWLASDLIRTGVLGRWAYLGVLGACAPGEENAVYARLEEWIRHAVPEFQLTTGREARR